MLYFAFPRLWNRGVELEGKIITVTLGNNRFCWCKGASHRSNHVYLVADLLRGDFYQILCLENTQERNSDKVLTKKTWGHELTPVLKLKKTHSLWISWDRFKRQAINRQPVQEVLRCWLPQLCIAELQDTLLDSGKHAGGLGHGMVPIQSNSVD